MKNYGKALGLWVGMALAGMSMLAVADTEIVSAPFKLPVGVKTVAGSCWTSSIASSRTDAWRCMVGNEIHDPCFTTDVKDKLVCGFDPSDPKSEFILQLTKPLPKPEQASIANNVHPWLLQLADGSFCQPFTGTVPATKKGVAIPYNCESKEALAKNCYVGLLDGSIQPGKEWSAQRIVYCSSTESADVITKNVSAVTIKKVWN